MFKTKGILISILVTLILVVSGLTFAYWANNVLDGDKNTDGTVNIGTGEDVVTKVNVTAQSGKTLVPAGRSDEANEEDAVEVVYLNYTVTWTEENNAAEGTHGELAAEIKNIAIDGNTELDKFVNVNITAGAGSVIELNGKAVTVTVEVTLNEPATREDYLLIAGKDITFEINFAVTVL